MLLPIGIAVYVLWGGLRATFICDWSHTIILFTIIYICKMLYCCPCFRALIYHEYQSSSVSCEYDDVTGSYGLHSCSGTSPVTGGLHGMHDLLTEAGNEVPVTGNAQGSYLTMKSNQGLVFGAATILSGFSGIFCDQGEAPVYTSFASY